MINFKTARFIQSCPSYNNLPRDEVVEVGFAGRSNVGKSSLINALAVNKKLAKSSSVPGKTREINLFRINDQCRLADLPGYGYARVSHREQQRWGWEMTRYIGERPNLKGVVILMDMRHPLTKLDWEMIDLVRETGKAFAFVLNKADKLGKNDRVKAMKKVNGELSQRGIAAMVLPFSAEKRLGVKELAELLSGWLETGV